MINNLWFLYRFQLWHLLCSLQYWFLSFCMSLLCCNFIWACVIKIIYFFVSIVYYVLLSALLFCCLSFSINLSCVKFQFCVELYFNMYKLLVYSLCIYCAEFTINFSGFWYPFCAWILFEFVYNIIVICLHLFICMWFVAIVLPGVFVMARLECCCETETAIFAARTNLPVSYFQTWQVWLMV